jgi:hypothetical protein
LFFSVLLVYAIGVPAGSIPIGSVWPRLVQLETGTLYQYQNLWSMELDGGYLGESEELAEMVRNQFGFDDTSHVVAWRYGLGDNECGCEGFLFAVTPMEPLPGVSLSDLAEELYRFQLSLGYQSSLSPTEVRTSTGETGYEWVLSFGVTGQREFLFADANGYVVRLAVVDMQGITDKSFINDAIDSFNLIEGSDSI